MTILILPGLYNSGPSHWQSLWENSLPGAHRVQQQDWENPQRDDWVASLSAAVNAAPGPVLLAAHSLGCALTAWWVKLGMPGVADKSKVQGALLVAPPDVNRADFPAPSFGPMPTVAFPFTCKVIVSSDDPWCDRAVAENWAKQWEAQFHLIGAYGHINGDSGLGTWEQGLSWMNDLRTAA
jgi:predicted alpha/beta hydrolase family esterase